MSNESSQYREISLHPKQGRAYKSENKVTLCCSGIQGGKTTVGSLWSLEQTSKWKGNENTAIIGAPTYKILNQSTLPTFLNWAQGAGNYLKGDQEFHFFNGLKVYIRTSTDADSIEGIQNVRWIWIDEAGKCKLQFWVNAEGRAARTNAPIFLTTTPYGMNWPYSHLIKPLRAGLRDDVGYFEWLSIDNPSFPRSEYERQRRILDPKTFRRKYMGIHERMEGLVYDLNDDHKTPSFQLPNNTKYYAGVDWGFSEGHEFAVLVRAITENGKRYDVHEFKQAHLDPNQQIRTCMSLQQIYGIKLFACDPARPDMIAALNKAGGRALGFHEGKERYKQLVPSITLHNALIRSGNYKVFEDKCSQTLDEYETYHWAEYEEDKPAKEEPVGINDHLMDCARMLTVATMNIEVQSQPEPFMHAIRPKIDHWSQIKKSKANRSWDSY